MRWFDSARTRLHLLFKRRAAEERLQTEFRFHLEMEAERLNRGSGLDPQEARRRACVAFGGQERYAEEMRDGRWPGWFIGLQPDVRHGLRALRAAPGFTAICVLILGLGIGTSTAIFAAFDAVMLQDLPVTEPDRVVTFTAERRTGTGHAVSPDELEALRRTSQTLRDAAGVVDYAITTPLIEGNRPLVLDFTFVTANFFDVLGARPVVGRLFRPEDGAAGAAPVTVISHRTWQREFGGDPDVLGRRLTATQSLNFGPYSIVGVAPPGIDYPVGIDYWVLLGPRRQASHVVARLMPNVTPRAARSEFLTIVQALDRGRANPGSPTAATVVPLTDAVLGDARPIAIAITVAVALLLLIACVNVGNLLLMRLTRRFGDVMVRRALGATPGEIARLFLVESALLGVFGGILGFGLAWGLLRVLPAWAPAALPRTDMIGLAARPAAVAVGVTALAFLLFGVLPSLATARGNLASALRTQGPSGSGSHRNRRLRRALVAAQVSLAAIVLVGAGLLLHTLQRLHQLELGYETEGVAIVEVSIDREGVEGGAPEIFATLEGIFQRLRDLPSVTTMTPVMSRPFTGTPGVRVRPLLEGQPESEIEANPRLTLEWVGTEFFRTFGIPILRGRGLLENDREDAPKVAVVSQTVAERLWPGRDPIGQRIRMRLRENEWWTIVGVAGDTRYQRLRELTPTVYLPWRQFQVLPMVWTIAVRTERELASLVPLMRRTLGEYSPRIVVWRTGTMTDHLASGPLAQPRASALLFSGFGLTALLLAAVGLYAVLALAVRERTRELGIRRALGAPAARLRRDVLRDAVAITAAGTAAGLGAAVLASRLLETLLFEVRRADPLTLVGVCIVLLSVSLVAAYIPARRATRIDPMLALREN